MAQKVAFRKIQRKRLQSENLEIQTQVHVRPTTVWDVLV